MTDKAIVMEIGNYIRHHRLAKNLTQSRVAQEAGINRWTISQIENGEPISLSSLIQILRSLDLLDVLNCFEIEKKISPLQLARIEHRTRKRARESEIGTKPESEW